jgi:hypothetical protein
MSRQDEIRKLAPLRLALKKRTVDELKSFNSVLCEKLHDLDTPMHYNKRAGKPSGDSFLYFRLFAVGSGEVFYYDFLENPNDFNEPLAGEQCNAPEPRSRAFSLGQSFVAAR